MVEPRCEQHGIEIKLDIPEDLPRIKADSSGIHRAILNIVGNAVDALETMGGQIILRATRDPVPDCIRIDIEDNGPGIPQEHQSEMFKMFFTTKGARGTGLGLAVTEKIVREHNGRILVKSEEGGGTTFTLILPRDHSGEFYWAH